MKNEDESNSKQHQFPNAYTEEPFAMTQKRKLKQEDMFYEEYGSENICRFYRLLNVTLNIGEAIIQAFNHVIRFLLSGRIAFSVKRLLKGTS